MSTTVINVPPESEPHSDGSNQTEAEISQEQIENLSDDVATVADEILVEVKECRTEQKEVMADLAALREKGAENSTLYQELLTELKNLRGENRNLNLELKELLSRQPSPLSTPSISQQTPEVETTVGTPIDPESVGDAGPVDITVQKKKKRYKI